ncbi:uncharacterized protein LOC121799296 [Salvia splendens]|uniref:uncharacterized protein LOC121799296 n=1 Tax=Salvia splendens TaxID=180675 RepID=UPI001C27323C|nr:uncharacterized protein LOC121799296 [Salvia splendens]
MLPDSIAIKTISNPSRGHSYYNEKERSVTLGEQSVFSTLVKIEVERATIRNPKYVHLRFSNSNRYWSKRDNCNVVVAESKQPKEDVTEPSCRLFQAPGEPPNTFYLVHVPTSGCLLVNLASCFGGAVLAGYGPIPISLPSTTATLSSGRSKYKTTTPLHSATPATTNTALVFSTTREARLVVQELVSQRNVYNVRYRMQDARIYGELPYVAGASIVTNTGRQEATMAVQVTYQDQKSYSFSRSFSLTAGVETTIKACLPFIAEGAIKVSFNINPALQWADTTTTSVMASNSVAVPERSTVCRDEGHLRCSLFLHAERHELRRWQCFLH